MIFVQKRFNLDEIRQRLDENIGWNEVGLNADIFGSSFTKTPNGI